MSEERKYRLVDDDGVVVGEYNELPKQIHITTSEDTAIIFGSRKKLDRRDFVKVYTEHLEWLAVNIQHFTTRRVLDILLANMDYYGKIRLTQEEIAKKLGIKRPNVSTAIKELESLNIVQCEKEGRGNIYHVNDSMFWKGDIASKQKHSQFRVIEGGASV